MKPAFRTTDLAGASRAGDRQSDCLVDLGLGGVGYVPAPIEAERAELLLDLEHPEGATLDESGLDPRARAFQKVAPAFLAVGVALGRLRPADWTVKQARICLHQLDPPIRRITRH